MNSSLNRFHFFILLLFGLAPSAYTQIDTLPPDAELDNQDFIEDVIQSQDPPSTIDFDFNTLFEDLNYYQRKPLNLNKASVKELLELGFSEIQANNLISYREEAGELIAIYELQAVPDFELEFIEQILPYVTVKGDVDDFQISPLKMITQGTNELYLRWNRFLEEQEGFKVDPETGEPDFLGDPNRFYARFRHSYSNKLSYGITAEKDIGEEFFEGSNTQGFDFYSAFFYMKDYNKWLKNLAIGDYSISLGQGLILHSGFGGTKSSQVLAIKKSGRTIRPYSSVNEAGFMRGAAATIGLGSRLEVTAFASQRKRDGNLTDTIFLDNEAVAQFSSLLQSGLHRTTTEIADENAIEQTTFGGAIQYRSRRFSLSANALYDQFDKKLTRRPQPYNRFYFNGDRLLNTSIDYSYIYQNFHFFGETALSDNGAIATVNGLFIGLDKKLDFGLLFRHLPRDYQALNSNVFAETSQGNNETGLYMALEFHPNRSWTWSGFIDFYQHPWLRFQIDAPSRGYEYRTRLTYRIKRKLDIYVEARSEFKDVNAPSNTTKSDFLVTSQLTQFKFHVSNKINKSLELRSRVHVGYFDDGTGRQNGFQMHQDVLFKPVGSPFSFTARYALFDTDGFDIRFYAYENSLLYAFSIPPYFNRGSRFYINVRYKGIRNLTLEGRIAQTYFSDRESVGSGRDEIEGSVRTEVAAQIKYKF